MASVMASVSVAAAGVQPLKPVPTSTGQVHLGSASRLGGFRLTNVAHSGAVALRRSGRPATVVVRADDSVTGKVQDAVGGAARKVQETAGAAKDKVQDAAGAAESKLEDAGDYLAGKADQAQDSAQDAGRDVQNQAEKLGDRAADAGRDLEGSAKSASRDARGEAENLGVSLLAFFELGLLSSLIALSVSLVVSIVALDYSEAVVEQERFIVPQHGRFELKVRLELFFCLVGCRTRLEMQLRTRAIPRSAVPTRPRGLQRMLARMCRGRQRMRAIPPVTRRMT